MVSEMSAEDSATKKGDNEAKKANKKESSKDDKGEKSPQENGKDRTDKTDKTEDTDVKEKKEKKAGVAYQLFYKYLIALNSMLVTNMKTKRKSPRKNFA